MSNFAVPRPSVQAKPLRYAVLAQIAGAIVVGGAAMFASSWDVPALAWALFHGVCALCAAAVMRLPRWWWWISFFFVPLAVLAQDLNLPPWVWLFAFVLLLLVFWRTDSSRVPLYMSNALTAQALLQRLPVTPCQLIDLGCGDGRLLRQLARARPDCVFVGMEHAPLTWVWAWFLGRGLPNLQILYGSFWDHHLGAYDVVYAFLSPVPMPRLWAKACAEAKAGAVLVSNSFAVPEVSTILDVRVKDSRQTCLLIYQPLQK